MTTVSTFRQKLDITEAPVARTALTAIVWLAWLWLYSPTLTYLQHIFTIQDFRTNQILLVGVVALLCYRLYEKRPTANDETTESSQPFWPLVLIFGSTILWLATERWIAINTLSATLFGLGSYGLLGLSLDKNRWRNGLPAALLIIGTLPFGAHIETFLGYPLRVVTAQLVGDLLASAGYTSIGVDTILIFENGVSKVDLPCSGVQSLWTGALFFLTATWLEDKKLGIRWLITLGLFAIVLIVANTARVLILVTVGEAFGWHLAAEMLHVPLGVLGFVAACLIALAMLRYFVPEKGQHASLLPKKPSARVATDSRKRVNAHVVILGLIVVGGVLYAARPVSGLTTKNEPLIYPNQLEIIKEPLTAGEQEWLTKDGAESAERMRFTWRSENGTRTGSMILISSRTWRAHHRPERCFEVYGLNVNDSGTHLVNLNEGNEENPMAIRQVNLADQSGETSYRAVYWFQSADTITDDYGSRLWADVTAPNTRWMLVSILFDEKYPADDPAIEEFYLAMNETVAKNLSSEVAEGLADAR